MIDVLEVKCEPPDDATHVIKPMYLTPKNLRIFWEKARQHRTLFSEEVNGDFKKFMEIFLREGPHGLETNGLFWVVDEFLGLIYITDIQPGIDAQAHFTFFDGRLRGRENIVKEMLKYGMEKYGFHRLTVELGMYVRPATFLFVERVGFKAEGRKRAAAFYRNDWFDVRIYGILREEVLKNGSQA